MELIDNNTSSATSKTKLIFGDQQRIIHNNWLYISIYGQYDIRMNDRQLGWDVLFIKSTEKLEFSIKCYSIARNIFWTFLLLSSMMLLEISSKNWLFILLDQSQLVWINMRLKNGNR